MTLSSLSHLRFSSFTVPGETFFSLFHFTWTLVFNASYTHLTLIGNPQSSLKSSYLKWKVFIISSWWNLRLIFQAEFLGGWAAFRARRPTVVPLRTSPRRRRSSARNFPTRSWKSWTRQNFSALPVYPRRNWRHQLKKTFFFFVTDDPDK